MFDHNSNVKDWKALKKCKRSKCELTKHAIILFIVVHQIKHFMNALAGPY